MRQNAHQRTQSRNQRHCANFPQKHCEHRTR
jgi:hypothetical protein